MNKKIFGILFGVIIGGLVGGVASATSKVQFEGGAEDFVFYPSGSWTTTDLFGGVKDMYSGDVRSETIIVRSTSSKYEGVKIYLRAEPRNEAVGVCAESDASAGEFLGQLNMMVSRGGEVISAGNASDAAGLLENVLIGEFSNGEEVEMTVTVVAPETLSNRYQHCHAEIDWIFTAEMLGKKAPDTGFLTKMEGGAVASVAIVGGVAIFGVVMARILRRKKKSPGV